MPSPHPRAAQVYRYQFSDNISLDAVMQQFDSLTFPRFSREMRFQSIRQPLSGVLVSQGQQPVGLVLAERRADNDGALIRSLFVAPDQRRNGLARGLLRVLEQALAAQGCPHIDIFYRTDWSSYLVVEHLLQCEGWLPPIVYLYQYRCNVADALAASGNPEVDLPPGFSLFPWAELSPAEQQEIKTRQANEHWYPSNLDPFQLEGYPVFGNSMGLRCDRQVVGWMITHRTGPETIQYTSLFTAPELRGLGRAKLAWALIIGAARRQLLQGIPIAIFQVEANNRPMRYFTQRYLADYMKVNELRVARKLLGRE